MKSYPSFKNMPDLDDQTLYVWDKLDGSNVRAEWTPKNGFYKFGTKHRLMNQDEPVYGEAIALIQAQEEALSKIFREERWTNVVCFFEFYGKNSFAGCHIEEPHQVTLIDVNVLNKGILKSNEFYKIFKRSGLIPAVVHRGRVGKEFIQQIRLGQVEGVTFEGVVCKSAATGHMFKLKSQAWLDKLKDLCNGDQNLFKELE